MTDGARAVQTKATAVFTKRIPFKNVRSFEGTNARQEIIEDRVLFFLVR